MATFTTASPLQQSNLMVSSIYKNVQISHQSWSNNFLTAQQKVCGRTLGDNSRTLILGQREQLKIGGFFTGGFRCIIKPVSAARSGAALSTDKDFAVNIKDAEVVVESQDNDNIQLRVDIPGKETQKVFDRVLINLGRTAPAIPGFRKEKGGKNSKIPKDFLLQILGEDRVTNFVIKEILTSTVSDYLKKENLNVKENQISTIQTEEELKLSFVPGNEFGFNVKLELEQPESDDVQVELEQSESETTTSRSSD